MRKVTEADFRRQEFRDANVEDYELREDGEVVRKDRWEMGMRRIQRLILPNAKEFEVDEVIDAVQRMISDCRDN